MGQRCGRGDCSGRGVAGRHCPATVLGGMGRHGRGYRLASADYLEGWGLGKEGKGGPAHIELNLFVLAVFYWYIEQIKYRQKKCPELVGS